MVSSELSQHGELCGVKLVPSIYLSTQLRAEQEHEEQSWWLLGELLQGSVSRGW